MARTLGLLGLGWALMAPGLAEATVAGGGVAMAVGDFDLIAGVEGNVFVDLPVLEGLSVGGVVTYYFVDNATLLSVDPNAHYAFVRNDGLDVYALAGLNVLYASVSALGVSISDLDIGLDAGIGVEAKLGAIHPYAEGKVALHGSAFLGLSGGVRFAF